MKKTKAMTGDELVEGVAGLPRKQFHSVNPMKLTIERISGKERLRVTVSRDGGKPLVFEIGPAELESLLGVLRTAAGMEEFFFSLTL